MITEEIFEAFLKCATKSYLYFHEVVGVPSEFSQSQGVFGLNKVVISVGEGERLPESLARAFRS